MKSPKRPATPSPAAFFGLGFDLRPTAVRHGRRLSLAPVAPAPGDAAASGGQGALPPAPPRGG
jgi:hypothetical protein